MSVQPVINAKDVPLSNNPGSLPTVYESLLQWFQPLTFVRIVKSVVDSQLVETRTAIVTQGVIQSANSRNLEIKPIGQRKWIWKTLHALPGLLLEPDDIIIQTNILTGDIEYRVMAQNDYTEYGYVSYNLVQNYSGDE